jgi:REP element-mobilizing transposase RayT
MPVLKIHQENEDKAHFITLTTIEWINIFTKPEYFQALINSLKYCQEKLGLLIYGFVFMTNHIHLIVQAKEGYKLSNIIQSYKRYTTEQIKKLVYNDSRKYIKALIDSSFYKKESNIFQLWQEYNYPETIISEKFLLTKLNYIHQNPVKKEYVDNPEDWKYSSAKFYLTGDTSLLSIDQF